MDGTDQSNSSRAEWKVIENIRQALWLAMTDDASSESTSNWLQRFQFLAKSFRRPLERLFSLEERDSYIGFKALPDYEQAHRLLSEHRRIEQNLDGVVVQASNTGEGSLSRLLSLRQRMESIFTRLDYHSKREAELSVEAGSTMLGAVD